MKDPLIALIAVLCNVGAQLSMKYSNNTLKTDDSAVNWLSPWLLCAVVLYGLSFLLTVRVYAVNALSVASPSMAGATFLLITLASGVLLGEAIGYHKIFGIGLIFFGIVLLTRT